MKNFSKRKILLFMAMLPSIAALAAAFTTRLPLESTSFDLGQVYTESLDVNSIEEAIQLPEQAWWQAPKFQLHFLHLNARQIWSKINLPSSATAEAIVAESHFLYFTDFEFYVVDKGRVVERFFTGSEHPESFAKFPSPNFRFDTNLSTSPRLMYVRALRFGSVLPEISVYGATEFRALSDLRNFLSSFLTGLSSLYIVVNFIMYIFLRSSAYTQQALIQTSFLITIFFVTGDYKQLFPGLEIGIDVWSKLAIISAAIGFFLVVQYIDDHLGVNRNLPQRKRRHDIFKAMLLPMILVTLLTPCMVSFPLLIGGLTIFWVPERLVVNKYANLPTFFLILAAHSTALTAATITFSEIAGILPHTLLNHDMAHIGIVLLSGIYAISTPLRLRTLERRQQRIDKALHGTAAKTQLNNLLTSSYVEAEAVTVADVSIMFVDIVSFTLLSRLRTPTQLFHELSRRLNDIVAVIEKHGGRVDRSLGDGVLCFFGYGSVDGRHAAAAFNAAKEIQCLTLAQVNSGPSDQLLMPVRIGIHSAKVFVGNLADASSLDFTMIGSGVNLASRLETACSPFKITLSEGAFSRLEANDAANKGFNPVLVAVKHHSELVRAYEFNPFSANIDDLYKAETFFLNQITPAPSDAKFKVKEGTSISLISELGDFVVMDFSRNGFRVLSDSLFGRRTVLPVRLITSSSAVNRNLQLKLLQSLSIEVRSSQASEGGYVHGLKIHGGNIAQRSALFDLLRAHLAGNSGPTTTDELIDSVAVG